MLIRVISYENDSSGCYSIHMKKKVLFLTNDATLKLFSILAETIIVFSLQQIPVLKMDHFCERNSNNKLTTSISSMNVAQKALNLLDIF